VQLLSDLFNFTATAADHISNKMLRMYARQVFVPSK